VDVSVVWLSSNIVGCIDEVTLCQPGWCCMCEGRQTIWVFNQPLRPTQLFTLTGMRNEFQPNCSDAKWQGSKVGHSSFHLWINTCWQVMLHDPY